MELYNRDEVALPNHILIGNAHCGKERGQIAHVTMRLKTEFVVFTNRELVTFFSQQEIWRKH